MAGNMELADAVCRQGIKIAQSIEAEIACGDEEVVEIEQDLVFFGR